MGQQMVSSTPIKQSLPPQPHTGTPQATTVTYPFTKNDKKTMKKDVYVFLPP
jgi:hypothetical protein